MLAYFLMGGISGIGIAMIVLALPVFQIIKRNECLQKKLETKIKFSLLSQDNDF